MSNFSFSHSAFKRLVSQGRQKMSLCGNGLNLIWVLPNFTIKGFEKVEGIWKYYVNRRQYQWSTFPHDGYVILLQQISYQWTSAILS